MIVKRQQVKEVLSKFKHPGQYGLDTETTGLRPYHGDRMFSLILSNVEQAFYFNFQEYDELSPDLILDREEVYEDLKEILEVTETTWFIHNAKFDMRMLAQEGLTIEGHIHDTEVGARLLYNQHMSYSLDNCLKRIGHAKDDAVKKYVSKHKLWDWVEVPGKKTRGKKMYYHHVPFDIMSAYGEIDGSEVRHLGISQMGELLQAHINGNQTPRKAKITQVYKNECALTKVLFKMEHEGVRVDRPYIEKAIRYEMGRMAKAEEELERLIAVPFKDSPALLREMFGDSSSYDSEHLEAQANNPATQPVLAYRDAAKKLNTYYRSFLYHADSEDRIHCNFRQSGTSTGRLSCAEPNLQNLTKEKDEGQQFMVRRSFIPDPDFCFVMIDFDQMEYRLLLDYAGEMDVIRAIMEEGLDVHTATAQKLNIDRHQAKTINFGLVYGQGQEKLARSLGCSVPEAKEKKQAFFRGLPRVTKTIRAMIERAEEDSSHWLQNWYGRRVHFPLMKNPRTGGRDRFTYRAPNHMIQGGCADIVKLAMVQCDQFLEAYRSKVLLQIHDEIIFQVHKEELSIVPKLKELMEKAYPHKRLPMSCSVDHSWKSWADKVPGLPQMP